MKQILQSTNTPTKIAAALAIAIALLSVMLPAQEAEFDAQGHVIRVEKPNVWGRIGDFFAGRRGIQNEHGEWVIEPVEGVL